MFVVVQERFRVHVRPVFVFDMEEAMKRKRIRRNDLETEVPSAAEDKVVCGREPMSRNTG